MNLYTYTPEYEVTRLHKFFRQQHRYSLPELYTEDLKEELIQLAKDNDINLNKIYIRKGTDGYYQLYSINHPLLPDHMRHNTSREKLKKLLDIKPQEKPVFNSYLENQLAKMSFSNIDNISLNSASYSTPCQWFKSYCADNVLSVYFTTLTESTDWEYVNVSKLAPIVNRY